MARKFYAQFPLRIEAALYDRIERAAALRETNKNAYVLKAIADACARDLAAEPRPTPPPQEK